MTFLDFDFWPTDGRFVPKSDFYGFSKGIVPWPDVPSAPVLCSENMHLSHGYICHLYKS